MNFLTNLIKSILPSSRTGKDPLRCIMRDESKCPYSPIKLGDLKLTHWIRHKIYKVRRSPAVIDTPRHDKKLMVIVPYRKREKHLEKFPAHVHDFLTKQNINHEILVIEQADEHQQFNKGKLLNIGVKLAWDKCDYFCLHDIDMLPEVADYSYINHPTLLANSISQFDTNPNHPTYFGGVLLFSKEDFAKINGFSNEYWHWGCEDDDLFLRCLFSGLTPVAYTNGRFKSQSHDMSITRAADGTYQKNEEATQKLNKFYLKNLKKYKKMRRGMVDYLNDGFNNVEFNVLAEKQFDLYKKISCEI